MGFVECISNNWINFRSFFVYFQVFFDDKTINMVARTAQFSVMYQLVFVSSLGLANIDDKPLFTASAE